MISRQWCGIAKSSEAGNYIAHLRSETFPHISRIPGFIGASVLRREVANGIEFRIVTTWNSMGAIVMFAGNNPESAVVPDNVRAMMVTYDPTVVHYEIVD
jgi:heme-degrading monooxygenase HmoA